MGFLGEKNSQRGLHSILSRRLYLGLSRKISNLSLHDLLHDPIRDLVQDPTHHLSGLIQSNPDFVGATNSRSL